MRTPTDVIGQHIHNVKFDVTSSDGGANGFNYEDGTFSPDEVRDRIHAINQAGWAFRPGRLLAFDQRTGFVESQSPPETLSVSAVREAYPKRSNAGDDRYGLFGRPPLGQDWDGAQTTIQRRDADPLLDDRGMDRTRERSSPTTTSAPRLTSRSACTPGSSSSRRPRPGTCPTASHEPARDGGPTSWEGYIKTTDPREELPRVPLEFQDTQLVYNGQSISIPSNSRFDPTLRKDASAAFDVGQYGELPGGVGQKNGGGADPDPRLHRHPQPRQDPERIRQSDLPLDGDQVDGQGDRQGRDSRSGMDHPGARR